MNRPRALAWFAKQWVGFTEHGGPNKGQAVERFQRAVDGKAEGEPWCLGFVFYCIAATEELSEELTQATLPKNNLVVSEHVMTAWKRAPTLARVAAPELGTIAIWNHLKDGEPTDSGHAGIVVGLLDAKRFETVEGNTSRPGGDQREGDGVYIKERTTDGLPGLRLLSFLRPWGKS
jgi:hypothetical protein